MNAWVEDRAVHIALFAVGAIALGAGCAFWIWNPEPDMKSSRVYEAKESVASASTSVAPAQFDPSIIIGANIFSQTRTPPSRRYSPADDQNPPAAEMAPAEVQMPSAIPQLFGTVLGPGGAMALMQADSVNSPSKMFREGEKIGPFRIVKIKTKSVILAGPAGRIEIPVESHPTGAQ